MNLHDRYRRLTFWNKFGFWGAAASLVALLVSLSWCFYDIQSRAELDRKVEKLLPPREVVRDRAIARLSAAGAMVDSGGRDRGTRVTFERLSRSPAELADDLRTIRDLVEVWAPANADARLQRVHDLSWLKGLDHLVILNLQGQPVTDVSSIGNLDHLMLLWLSGTNVRSIAPLRGLKNLKFLDISETQVTDLSPLRDLERLETVSLGGSKAKDLSPLYDCRQLTVIDLTTIDIGDGDEPSTEPVWSQAEVEELRHRLPNTEVKYP